MWCKSLCTVPCVQPVSGSLQYCNTCMHWTVWVQQQRRHTCTPLHTPTCRFTILVHMSNCMQCLIFFTCVSFVLYLKFIKYQIYYGLIFYLSLNDSLNLKSPPAIAITCKTTQQIRKKERKKEQTATTNKSSKQHHIN